MGFATNIHNLRIRARLSQDDIARALNITRPAYKQLEMGEREPSASELEAISELFGQRVDDLIDADIPAQTDTQAETIADGLNRIKYKNLILYLAQRVGAQPNVGETVFYKLIYFVETLSIYKTKKAITGEKFYKMQYGPVPASFQSVTLDMINSGELDRVQGRFYTYRQTKYLPRVRATALSDSELKIIEDVISSLGSKSATELSDLSHKDMPWIDAEDGDFVDLNKISETEPRWAYEMGRLPEIVTPLA